MYRVNYLISDRCKTIGANIQEINGKAFNIRKEDFIAYKGKLENAIVTVTGVMKSKRGKLKIIESSKLIQVSSKVGKQINTYTIMYRDTTVLTININTNKVAVSNEFYIPFALKNKQPLLVSDIREWIRVRVDNINRTYMNLVYIAREVGRDTNKVLRDSCGISFTDNYWIKTNDIDVTWDKLKGLRDTNSNLNEVALKGKLDLALSLKSGYTSLFSTKGYFPKAIYNNWMYKRKEDSILEYPAYLIGKQLGISISEVKLTQEYVGIKLFTSDKVSLIHASELKEYYNSDDELYNIMYVIGRTDIAAQMQRMFIYNYIIGNPDLHEDNYGLIYDADTFNLISLSPCYDHNVAFQEGFNGLSRGRLSGSSILTLDEYTKNFIKLHTDIIKNLKKLDLMEVSQYLNKRQLDELKYRIQLVLSWSK